MTLNHSKSIKTVVSLLFMPFLVYLLVNFFGNTIIMIMKVQYSGTALLLLVNSHITQNNGTVRPTYVII